MKARIDSRQRQTHMRYKDCVCMQKCAVASKPKNFSSFVAFVEKSLNENGINISIELRFVNIDTISIGFVLFLFCLFVNLGARNVWINEYIRWRGKFIYVFINFILSENLLEHK